MKARHLVFLTILLHSSFSFEITQTNQDLSESEITSINKALENDELFKSLEITNEDFKNGYSVYTANLQLEMGRPEIYTVKISKQGHIFDEARFQNERKVINPVTRYDPFERFSIIRQVIDENIPLVSLYTTYRRIVAKGSDNLPVVFTVIASKNDGDFASFTSTSHKKLYQEGSNADINSRLIDLYYKLVIATKRLSENGIVTGLIDHNSVSVSLKGPWKFKAVPVIKLGKRVHRYDKNYWASDAVKYEGVFRPPEMDYFINQNRTKLLTGPLGYKYSGKEDLYAVTVLVIYFAWIAEIKVSPDLINIINKVVVPYNYDWIRNEIDKAPLPSLVNMLPKQGMKKLLTRVFKEEEERLNELAKEICLGIRNLRKVKNRGPLKEFMKTNLAPYGEPYNPLYNKYYSLYRKFMDEFYNGDYVSQDLFKMIKTSSNRQNIPIDEFFKLEYAMLQKNPFDNVIKNRLSADEVLVELYKISDARIGSEPTMSYVRNDIFELAEFSAQTVKDTDPSPELKSMVYIEPSIYDVQVIDLRSFILNINFALKKGIQEDKVDIEMPDNAVKSCTPYSFASKFTNMIRTFKASLHNRYKSFLQIKPIEIDRKLLKNTKQKEEKINRRIFV